MAKLLFKEGYGKILSDDVGKLNAKETNQLIKTAGTTCYQSRETSKKTPEEFVQMAQKNKHFSVLEHSWACFKLRSALKISVSPILPDLLWEIIGFQLFKANSLFCITTSGFDLTISGNARMFNEAYKKFPNGILGNILALLHMQNPVLYPAPNEGFCRADGLEVIQNLIFSKEELIHRAMTVEFNNCSRGFTHETVRSRNGNEKIASYSQESTRYVDYAKGEVDLDEFQMKFVLPYKDDFVLVNEYIEARDFKGVSSVQGITNMIEEVYRILRKAGLKPEEARQWLPIGIKSQIVQTMNLNEWKHWFKIRTQKAAHPEIRFVATKLLKEAQQKIPIHFDDFKVAADGESATYVGDDELA